MKQPTLFKGIHPTIAQVKGYQRLTVKQLEIAEEVYIRAFASRCPHTPSCGNRTSCIKTIAREQREKGYV